MSELDEKKEILTEAEEKEPVEEAFVEVEAEETPAAEEAEKAAAPAPKKFRNPFEGKSFKSPFVPKEGTAGNWFTNMNLPNQLTTIRVGLIPLFVIFLLAIPKPAGNILAVIVFIAASLTDLFDGKIARKENLVTNFGKFMDPLADKLLVCSALICLVDLGRIESWIVIIIIAREFIISGFRLIAAENQKVIAANQWGKFKTASQMIMVILLIVNFASGPLFVLTVIVKYAALVLTIISLCDYIYKNKQVLSMQG
jgi:CDP-diacylglycerol--glycerol-3-phosphate 3-phosphatidyltransferase